MAWKNSTEKTALLIDGANCHETCRHLRWWLDFAKVLSVFQPQQAYYFTALPENNKDDDPRSIFRIMDFIVYNGYSLVSKPMKEYINNGIVTKKGNMDVEIALYMMKVMDWAEHIILFSGDGDFRMAVEEAQSRGVKVTVVSALRCNPPMVSDELRRQANRFIDMCAPEWRQTMEWRG